MARLGDICDILNGYAFKSEEYVESGIRIIRISNVQKGFVEDNTPVFYPEDDLFAKKYALHENDLLLSLTGNVGRVALLGKQFLPAALNQRVACLRPKAGIPIRKQYLFHVLNSDSFEKDCIYSSKGIAQKNMSTEWLKDYPIVIPCLEEQDRFCSVLDMVDSLISLRKKQLQKLDDLVKSRFVEMFGTYPENEKGWFTGTIRELVTDVKYGSSRKAADGDSGKYPYLRMNNITYGGELDLTDTKTIDVPDDELEKCTVHRGDLLFNRTNSKELVGKTCVYNRDEMMVLAGFVVRVRLNEKVLPEFVSAFMNTDFSKHMLLNMCKAAIGQANINAQELQNIGIYVPPIEIQKDFVSYKEQVDKSKLTLQQGLDKLELLKQSLMQKYFG